MSAISPISAIAVFSNVPTDKLFCDGQFIFQPRTQIVNRYGHWAIFGFSTYNSVMHEVFFFFIPGKGA